jgi:hypothetical protein
VHPGLADGAAGQQVTVAETVYRKQLRPVIEGGADVMDRIFAAWLWLAGTDQVLIQPGWLLSFSAPQPYQPSTAIQALIRPRSRCGYGLPV